MIDHTITISDALQVLTPKSNWAIRGDVLEWMDDVQKQPTKSVIDAKLAELQAEYDAQAYARNRSTEYPALAEQLDEIYHNGIASWKAVIKVTKDKYPKG